MIEEKLKANRSTLRAKLFSWMISSVSCRRSCSEYSFWQYRAANCRVIILRTGKNFRMLYTEGKRWSPKHLAREAKQDRRYRVQELSLSVKRRQVITKYTKVKAKRPRK